MRVLTSLSRRCSALLFCTILAGSLTERAPAVAADDAAALLAKHRAFVGWSGNDPATPPVVLTGTVGGASMTLYRRGNAYRFHVAGDETKLTADWGYTGNVYWRSNFNALTVPVIGDGARYYAASNAILDERFADGPGTIRGNATIDGAQTTIVRVDPPSAFPIDCYIDPASGQLRRAVIDPGGESRTMQVLSYGTLTGDQKVVTQWRYGEHGRPYVVTTAKTGVTLADADLHPPPALATWTFAAPAPIGIVANMTQMGGSVEVAAKVNGVEGRFILDSGASTILLSESFADRVGAKTVTDVTYQGVNELQSRGRILHVDSVEVGGNVLHNVNVSSGAPFGNYDGLLGFDFLAAAIVDVDLRERTLTMYDPSKMQATTANAVIVTPDLYSGQPVVPVTIDGSAKANVIFDSGDSFEVLLSDALYDSHRVSMHLEGYAQLSGVSGTSSENAPCGHAETIELGAVTYTNVPLCFGPKSVFGTNGGLVGFDFLKHFNWTFDYPDGRWVLTPNGIK